MKETFKSAADKEFAIFTVTEGEMQKILNEDDRTSSFLNNQFGSREFVVPKGGMMYGIIKAIAEKNNIQIE